MEPVVLAAANSPEGSEQAVPSSLTSSQDKVARKKKIHWTINSRHHHWKKADEEP